MEVGLRATAAEPALEKLLWELLLEYERDMKLLEPIDPATAVASQDRYTEDGVLAIIDSAAAQAPVAAIETVFRNGKWRVSDG